MDKCKCRDRMNLQEKWQLNLRQKEATIEILKKPQSGSPAGKTHFFHCNLLLGWRVEEEQTEKKPQQWWVFHVINKDFKYKEKKKDLVFWNDSEGGNMSLSDFTKQIVQVFYSKKGILDMLGIFPD